QGGNYVSEKGGIYLSAKGDAIKLFKMITNSKEIDANASRVSRILSIKNMAEYEERLVFRSESEKILKDCERLFDYIKKQLPQE
ncbi:MAG: hypothetical protein ABIA77_04110, partial [Candidatus Omnitrophota bacterium]